MDNQKLSARVEALEGPDREADAEIARACGAEYGPKSGWCDNESGDYWTVENCALHYTASLDVAMSLVPEGYGYEVRSMDGLERHIAGCFFDDTGEPDFWAQAATPAIALCAAALKARGL